MLTSVSACSNSCDSCHIFLTTINGISKFTRLSLSMSPSNILRCSIPRQMIWCKAPGVSILDCLGIVFPYHTLKNIETHNYMGVPMPLPKTKLTRFTAFCCVRLSDLTGVWFSSQFGSAIAGRYLQLPDSGKLEQLPL